MTVPLDPRLPQAPGTGYDRELNVQLTKILREIAAGVKALQSNPVVPGGSSGQLQANSAGSFAGTAALAYAATGTHLTATALAATYTPLAVKAAASQSANLQEWRNSAGTAAACVNAGGEYEALDSAKGIILKSPDGTRWRVQVTNAGALTATAL